MGYEDNSELRQNISAAINREIHFQTQQAASAENQGSQQSGTRATRQKIFSSNSKTTNSNRPRNKGRSIVRDCSKSVGKLEAGKKICGKRRGDVHLKLPSKHKRVSKDDSDNLYSMVEADDQPHQSQ